MAISEITHAFTIGGTDGGTTNAVDTTGANLIVLGIARFYPTPAPTITDTYGNTWTGRTEYIGTDNGSSFTAVRIYDTSGTVPTVGTGHDFSAMGSVSFASVGMESFSGAALASFDQQNGASKDSTDAATSIQTGSVTPSENSEVVCASLQQVSLGVPTIDSGFTLHDAWAWGAGAFGSGLAYKIQTTAAAVNPTWSWTGASGSGVAADIATYKAITIPPPPGGGSGRTRLSISIGSRLS